MSEPRVAFLIHGLVVGGAEKFFISLVNHFYRSGHNPLVILLSDQNALFGEMDAGVESVIIKRKYKYDLNVGRQIKTVLDKHHVDRVFTVGIFSFFLLKLYFLADKGKTFFLSLHSTIPRTMKEHLCNYVYFRFISDRDRVLFICNAQKEYLRKKYGFNPARSSVIYNGIDTTHFTLCGQAGQPSQQELKAKYGIKPEEKVIVKIARMFREKGHRYGIDALSVLHSKHNCRAHLFFVGSGDDQYLHEMQEYAKKSAVASYIHFIEHQKDVRPYYCMGDLFTLTSYTTETFSLAALEAMSSGRPCSLTNIGGAEEMINENTGTLSQSKNPESIADSWATILRKSYDPLSLHDYVESNFSLPGMISQYEKAVLPARQFRKELVVQ
jgi:glycosyltransferase involved in cell wall biosynthesis